MSFQILSTVKSRRGDESVAYIRLNFAKGTTFMGFAWNERKLLYTLPKTHVEPWPLTVAPVSSTEFVYVDWREDELKKISFGIGPNNVPTVMRFERAAGRSMELAKSSGTGALSPKK